MAKTLQELQREVKKLREINRELERKKRIKKQNVSEMRRIGRERERLRSEIKKLKNPKTALFKSNLKRGLKVGGKNVFRFLENVTDNFERQYGAKQKITKKKKPRKKKK